MFFSGIGCFEVIFSLQVNDVSQSYQALLRRVLYALQEPLKKDLETTEAASNSPTRCG